MNPDPLTLRHLYWMSRGKQKVLWDHTCEVIAALINVNRGKHSSPVRASQLHPLRRVARGSAFDGETMRAISASLKAREANA